MGKIILLLISVCSAFTYAQNTIQIVNKYTHEKQNMIYDELLYVSVQEQKMYHLIDDLIIKKYNISTSEHGVGNIKNTNKTPLGLHSIKEKHGENTPINGRMIARKFNGKIAKIYKTDQRSKTDDITTRILWLTGEEEGYNKGGDVDSYKRYIYIHGTSEEGRLGKPSSHGCIRMNNQDILDLYNKIIVGTKVLILDK